MKYFFYLAFAIIFFGSVKSMELAQIDEGQWMLTGISEGYISKPVNLSRFKGHIWDLDPRYQYAFLKDGALPLEKREDVLHCIKSQAERGEAEALCNLGYYYEYIAQQPKEAEKYYTLAVEKGLARANYLLGDYYSRDNRDPDQRIAEGYMQRAADLNYEPALIRLSYWHFNLNLPDSKDYYEKAVALRKAFSQKNGDILGDNLDDNLMTLIILDIPIDSKQVLNYPYLYDKAALSPSSALCLIKAGLVKYDPDDDIFIRTLLAAHYGKDPVCFLNLGLLSYKRWKNSKSVQYYADAIQYLVRAASTLSDYELGLIYLNYKEDFTLNNEIDLKNTPTYQKVIDMLNYIGVVDPGLVMKEVGRYLLIYAANNGHRGALATLSKAGLFAVSIVDVLKHWTNNLALGLNHIKRYIPIIQEYITANTRLPNSLFDWFKRACQESIDKLNDERRRCKKDKQKDKTLKKDIEKFQEFQVQCDAWVKEIKTRNEIREKAQRDAEKRQQKLEKEQQKKLLRDEKKQQSVSSKNVESQATMPDIKENVAVSENHASPVVVFDSPQISNRSQREDGPEIIQVKKEKIKTRPSVTNQPQTDRQPQDKTEPVARPPLIRQMSAVALVRKSSRTDLNDPKYKRLVKRLSCSDVISKVKLDEMDVKRTLEELEGRGLIEYRNEKTTLTATSKVNARTPPLVIHKHGDWASNRDIVKQFLQFVHDVDSEYWQ